MTPRKSPAHPSRPVPAVAGITDLEHNPRHDAIRKDIAKRLAKSCSTLSEEAFAALVDKILKVQIAGERRNR